MDFYKLIKQGECIAGFKDYNSDVWPDSKLVILLHDDKYETAISYNTKTFFVHKVLMTIYAKCNKDGSHDVKDISFLWISPESEDAFIKNNDDYDYCNDGYDGSPIRIRDKKEMDFMILKLKYM